MFTGPYRVSHAWGSRAIDRSVLVSQASDGNLLSGLRTWWPGTGVPMVLMVSLYPFFSSQAGPSPRPPEVVSPLSAFPQSCRDYHLAQSERESPPPRPAPPRPMANPCSLSPPPPGQPLYLLGELACPGAVEEQLCALWGALRVSKTQSLYGERWVAGSGS